MNYRHPIIVFLSFSSQLSEIKIETNILKLLPETETDPILDLAFENYAEKNMQQLIFLIENKNPQVARESASELSKRLSNSEWIETVISEISSDCLDGGHNPSVETDGVFYASLRKPRRSPCRSESE